MRSSVSRGLGPSYDTPYKGPEQDANVSSQADQSRDCICDKLGTQDTLHRSCRSFSSGYETRTHLDRAPPSLVYLSFTARQERPNDIPPVAILRDRPGQRRCDPNDALRKARLDPLLELEVGVLWHGMLSVWTNECRWGHAETYYFARDADDRDASSRLLDRASPYALDHVHCVVEHISGC